MAALTFLSKVFRLPQAFQHGLSRQLLASFSGCILGACWTYQKKNKLLEDLSFDGV